MHLRALRWIKVSVATPSGGGGCRVSPYAAPLMWPMLFRGTSGVSSLLRGRATPFFRRWPVFPRPLLLAHSSAARAAFLAACPPALSPGPCWDTPGGHFSGEPRVGIVFIVSGFFSWPCLIGRLFFAAPRPGSSGLGFIWSLGLSRHAGCLGVGFTSKRFQHISVYVNR